MQKPTGWPDEECYDDAWITHLLSAIHNNQCCVEIKEQVDDQNQKGLE